MIQNNEGRQTRDTSNQFRYVKPLDKYDQMDLEYNKRFKVDEKMLLSKSVIKTSFESIKLLISSWIEA